jgi:P27 family predicted phage terminase small subunit
MKTSAPEHLNSNGRKLFAALTKDYHITDPAEVKILTTLCEASDRTRSCREIIEAQGVTVCHRWGQVKPYPMLAAEREQPRPDPTGIQVLA